MVQTLAKSDASENNDASEINDASKNNDDEEAAKEIGN